METWFLYQKLKSKNTVNLKFKNVTLKLHLTFNTLEYNNVQNCIFFVHYYILTVIFYGIYENDNFNRSKAKF